jgi:hypothetical protein
MTQCRSEMTPHLTNRFADFLLSVVYADSSLHPPHAADLAASGIHPATIRRQHLRSSPPDMLTPILGRIPPTITSAYLIPYHDPVNGGWMDYQAKVFQPVITAKGDTIRYWQRRGTPPRIFFPIASVPAILTATESLWVVEGAKKPSRRAKLVSPRSASMALKGGIFAERSVFILTSMSSPSAAVSNWFLTVMWRRTSMWRLPCGAALKAFEARGARVSIRYVPPVPSSACAI